MPLISLLTLLSYFSSNKQPVEMFSVSGEGVWCQVENARSLRPSAVSSAVTVHSTPSRPSFTVGLARLIDRERPSYQRLAAQTAFEELLAVTAARVVADVLVTASSPHMLDAAVQSDHMVDLLAGSTPSPTAEIQPDTTDDVATQPQKVNAVLPVA